MQIQHVVAFISAWLTVMSGVGAAQAQTSVAPSGLDVGQRLLTNAASVRNLSPQVAARQLPVRLQGVVTYVFDRRACFVQDQSAGIFVGNGAEFPDLSLGQVVTVTGVSGPGEYAPTVVPTVVEVVGRTSLPPPHRASYDDLLTGREDSQ